MGVALSIVLGGLITILTAIGVEYFRRPKLRLAIEDPPLDRLLPDAKKMRRQLRLILHNESLSYGFGWMQRAAAIQCRGEITFHHLNDGQNIFGRVTAVRWANSPEPIASQIMSLDDKVQFYIQDFTRTSTESRIDVYPGEEQPLDVAVRFDGEVDCYGWNNDSYFYNWRNPNWKLGRDRFLVKVVITSSGQKCTGIFRLVNDVDSRTDFRLLPASATDRANVL